MTDETFLHQVQRSLYGRSIPRITVLALSHSARTTFGSSFIWTTKYLDGMVIAAVYLSLLLLAVLSWCFSLWKTWKLTQSDSLINTTRFLAFGWLLGAPLLIFLTAVYWISAMRIFTDFLVTVV